jgi:hypothetical protein
MINPQGQIHPGRKDATLYAYAKGKPVQQSARAYSATHSTSDNNNNFARLWFFS